MRKQIFTLAFLLLCSLALVAQTSDYVVQVAAFDTKVSLNYFNGLNGVYHMEDHNNIHKYYISGFTDKSAADASAQNARNLGYNAYVINMAEVRSACALACGMVVDPTKGAIYLF